MENRSLVIDSPKDESSESAREDASVNRPNSIGVERTPTRTKKRERNFRLNKKHPLAEKEGKKAEGKENKTVPLDKSEGEMKTVEKRNSRVLSLDESAVLEAKIRSNYHPQPEKLIGLRRQAAKSLAEEHNMRHHHSTVGSDWNMHQHQLTALQFAREKQRLKEVVETKQEAIGQHGVYTIMAAKSIAKKLHNKARSRNAIKWQALLKKAREQDIALQLMPEIVELMKAGIPNQIRGEVWKVFLGVDKMRKKHPKEYYRRLKEGAEYIIKESKKESKGVPVSKWLTEIEKDIPRTIPSVPLLKSKEGRASLLRILVCYYYRSPQSIGYCQGMNLIAGGLLTVMKNEEDAFWALVCVIESRLGYYTKSMAGLLVDQYVLRSLFAFYLPELYDHMKSLDVDVSSFTTSWFICLFMETPVPYKTCLGLWDYLFCYGDEMLFQVALAVLRKKRKEILAIDDNGVLLCYVLKLGADLEKWLLSDVSRDLGELIQSIATLRRRYQIQVLDENSKIAEHSRVDRIRKRYRIETAEEVQELWNTFLSPSPYAILVQNCIPSMVWFSSALAKAVYPKERRKWRESGLLSGFMSQMFNIVDVSGTRQINFDNFVWLTQILKYGSNTQRAKLVFMFFDMDGDGKVSKMDLFNGLKKVQRMYGGRKDSSDRRKFMMVNSFLFWYSMTRNESRPFKQVKVVMEAKPFGFTIGQLKIGKTRFLEVSSVDGAIEEHNVEPGWKIYSVNETVCWDKNVEEMVEICKHATLPCHLVFEKPYDIKMSSNEFVGCIDMLIKLEPRLNQLFFAREAKTLSPTAKNVKNSLKGSSRKTKDHIVSWFRDKLK